MVYFILPNNILITVPIYLISIIIIAGRMRGLEGCVHEATHFTLFKNRTWNRNLQFLYAWPIFTSVENYRKDHLLHHYRFGTDEDPTIIYYRKIKLMGDQKIIKKHPYFHLFIAPFFGPATKFYFQEAVDYCKKDRSFLMYLMIFWTLVFTAVSICGAWAWFSLFYLVPLFTFLPYFAHLSEIGDHGGLKLRSCLNDTRNNLGIFLHRYFIYPHDDGFHAIHHMHAGIPSHQLKKAYEALLKIDGIKEVIVSANSFNEMANQVVTSYGHDYN